MGPENLAGQTLGQYELRELLGVGGMGAVYRAYQSSLQREVAIKLMSSGLAAQPGYAERFVREAKTAAALEHPHIVPIVDYGAVGGTSYIVMRLLTGGTLAARLAARAEKLPALGEVSELLKQLASALDYAHSLGVIHRDLKPTNVMFDNQGNAYLVDFGIAKLVTDGVGMTSSGMMIGTPSYMAPEQWYGGEVSPAADLYALGVMTYQLVTGRVPFEASTPPALMYKHLHEMPTPVQMVREGLPEAVTTVLHRAMAKDAKERFKSVTAFAQAFEAAVAGHAGEATKFLTFRLPARAVKGAATPSRPSPGMRATGPKATTELVKRNPLILGIVGLIALLIMAAVFLLSRGEEPELDVVAAAQTLMAQQTAVAFIDLVTATAVSVLQRATAGTDEDAALTETASITPAPENSATPVPAIIRILDTETPTIEPSVTLEPLVASMLNTETLSPTPTETATATESPTETATATETNTATPAPSNTPTATATATATETPLPEPSVTPVPVIRMLDTETPSPTATETALPSETPTATSTFTPEPSETPVPIIRVLDTETPTATATETPTPTETWTATPSATLTATATETATATPTATYTPTVDVVAVAQTLAAQQTALAFIEQVTQTAIARDATATATQWTATPSVTSTPTLTPTITPSATATPSSTPTLTHTPALRSPVQLALTPVARNVDWTPVERDFDGMTMVLVPAGCFQMGSIDGNLDERPAHEQCFDEPFWIGKTEVTNAEYYDFIAAAGYSNPQYWSEVGWSSRQFENWSSPGIYSGFNDLAQPVVGVSWYEAQAYAAWRGMALCTEREWEYAARGPDKLVYPWGNALMTEYVIHSVGRSSVVGSLPRGASWVGALDMSGNVGEWTRSRFAVYPYYDLDDTRDDRGNLEWRVLRGGSWGDAQFYLRAMSRLSIYPSTRSSNYGFRVCRSSSTSTIAPSQTPIITPRATATLSATPSSTPTAQPASLPAVLPTLEVVDEGTRVIREVQIWGNMRANLRSGPSTSSSLVTIAGSDVIFVVDEVQSGASPASTWYRVQLTDGRSAWVRGDLVSFRETVEKTVRVNWTPLERDFNGVTMVLVPAGCFNMGRTHEQCFDQAFWIDKTEVTQAQLQRLGGIQARSPGFSGDDRPVENITWFEARDFCTLRGGRLPTEAEWEYAARGPENRAYPWGDTWNANNAVWNRNSTVNVGSVAAGASWVGALDMSGNVSEWTSSLYEPYPYDAQDGRERDTGDSTDVWRVRRGGSLFNDAAASLRAPNRNMSRPGDRDFYVGFRCARSFE